MCEPKHDDTKRLVKEFVNVDEPEDLEEAEKVVREWQKDASPTDPMATVGTP